MPKLVDLYVPIQVQSTTRVTEDVYEGSDRAAADFDLRAEAAQPNTQDTLFDSESILTDVLVLLKDILEKGARVDFYEKFSLQSRKGTCLDLTELVKELCYEVFLTLAGLLKLIYSVIEEGKALTTIRDPLRLLRVVRLKRIKEYDAQCREQIALIQHLKQDRILNAVENTFDRLADRLQETISQRMDTLQRSMTQHMEGIEASNLKKVNSQVTATGQELKELKSTILSELVETRDKVEGSHPSGS